MQRMTMRCGLGRTLLAAALLAMLAPAALAQDGGRRGRGDQGMQGMQGMRGGMNRQFQPDFVRRDAELITRELDLDDIQRSILESLILDYETAFTEAMDGAREQMTALRPQRDEDPARNEKRREVMGEVRDISRQLRAARRGGDEQSPVDPEKLQELQERFELLRGQMQELRPPMPEGEELAAIREQFSTISTDWRRVRVRLRDKFLADLQAVLAEPQAERWPAFVRTLRREKTISHGQLSGESVDLFDLVRDLRLYDSQQLQIADSMEAYSVTLDQALASRESFLETSQPEMMQAMFAGDMEAAHLIASEEAALRTAVRGVNEQFAEVVAAAMEDEATGARFTETFRSRAFPRIYRRTAMQRGFEAAREIDGLDPEVLGAIDGLEEAFLTELESANTQLRRLTREQEPQRTRERLERRRQGPQRGLEIQDREDRGDREEDPVRAAFGRRGELELAYRGYLESLLTPEQIALLPAFQVEREDRRGRRGQDDNVNTAERRQQLMEQFDRNGDGNLDDQEREALRDAMRSERGDRGNRAGGRNGGRGGGRQGNDAP